MHKMPAITEVQIEAKLCGKIKILSQQLEKYITAMLLLTAMLHTTICTI